MCETKEEDIDANSLHGNNRQLRARGSLSNGRWQRSDAADSMLPDDAARAADRARRTERFTQALQNMKILAEGGKLPPAPARGGTTAGGAPPR
jgi:hypothetical protein